MLLIFGGTVLKDNSTTNDVFWMTLDRMEWHNQPCKGEKPTPRWEGNVRAQRETGQWAGAEPKGRLHLLQSVLVSKRGVSSGLKFQGQVQRWHLSKALSACLTPPPPSSASPLCTVQVQPLLHVGSRQQPPNHLRGAYRRA